jgi:hypothetical protein
MVALAMTLGFVISTVLPQIFTLTHLVFQAKRCGNPLLFLHKIIEIIG